MNSVSWITLIGALGIGSIIAATVGWWSAKAVAIANHRQNWINALRDDLVAYLQAIDMIHFRFPMLSREGSTTDDLEKLEDARNAAMLVYRRILLRLNMTENDHLSLAEALFSLQAIREKPVDTTGVDNVVQSARRVLKREWEVTKYGIFTTPVILTKQYFKASKAEVRPANVSDLAARPKL